MRAWPKDKEVETQHKAITDALVREMESCKDDAQAAEIGEKWCIEQSKQLLKGGAPCLHYYTMSKIDGFVRIAKEVL